MHCDSKKKKKNDNFGLIEIELDNNVVNVNECLRGKILLSVTKNFPGNMINIIISGKEFCFWNEILAHGVYQHVGNNLFYESKINIAKFKNNSISIGNYVFPFSININEKLPSSFNFQEAKIFYEILAECNNEKNEYKKFIQIKKFEIKSKLQGSENVKIDKRILLRNLCCLNFGFVHFICKLEKDIYYPGDNAKVILEIDHSISKIATKTIIVKLVRNVHMESDLKSKHNFTDVIAEIVVEGVKANQAKIEKEINIFIPEKLDKCPTTVAKKFSCQYFLIISSVNQKGFGNFGTNYPKFQREIIIANEIWIEKKNENSEEISYSKINLENSFLQDNKYIFDENEFDIKYYKNCKLNNNSNSKKVQKDDKKI